MIVSCETDCDNCHRRLLTDQWEQVVACYDGHHVSFKHIDCESVPDPLDLFESLIPGTLI
jgi:hypothetical protein